MSLDLFARCEVCNAPIANAEDELCDNCLQNAAEAAWERHCEDFHDGGCTRFNSLLDQQAAALRYK